MLEYADLGIDSFILSGYPNLEEVYSSADLVFPLLPLAHGRARAADRGLAGPFGGMIAKGGAERRVAASWDDPAGCRR